MRMMCFIVLSLIAASGQCYQRSHVQLPLSYTAMKDDIVVSYSINYDSSTNSFKSFNAMIHLEYLPGDSILTNSHSVSSSVHLASLPIPLGVTRGSVVFPCGTIQRAGPHRALLTIDGQNEAESPVLQVGWPLVSIQVPVSLETYSSDVDITIALTSTICTPIMGETSGKNNQQQQQQQHPNSVTAKLADKLFNASLVLVECSKSLDYEGSCQMPSNEHDQRIWKTAEVQHFLYEKWSFSVRFNCSVWGQEGTFRVFFATDLTHAAVIGVSRPIVVRQNREYKLDSYFSTVFPCHEDDVKPLTVRRPQCAGEDDKVRVFSQGHRIVNGNFLPTQDHYLGEVRMNREDDNIAIFPCEMFKRADEETTKFCFHYISHSIIGTTNMMAQFCVAAQEKDLGLTQALWAQWSEWSECRPVSKCQPNGMKSRHRFCDRLLGGRRTQLPCQGKPVEYQACQGQFLCTDSEQSKEAHKDLMITWRPLSTVEATSPCACGCIYVVSNKRPVEITSGESCPSLPITWTIQASGKKYVELRLLGVNFSCDNSIMNVRKKQGNEVILVYQTEEDVSNSSHSLLDVSSTEAIYLQFHAPRRSCRINIQTMTYSRAEAWNKTADTTDAGTPSSKVPFTEHLPAVIIALAAFLITSLVCGACVICQFEYRRKKYVAWKSQPSSRCSTPSRIECKYEELHTSTEDLYTPGPRERKQKLIKAKLKAASTLLRGHFSKHRGQNLRLLHKRSFSASPLTMWPSDGVASPHSASRKVTGSLVKTALKAKSRRYKQGRFRPLNRPRTPRPTPLTHKRHSRSLSDIVSLLSLNCHMKTNSFSEDLNGSTTTIQPNMNSDQTSCSELSSYCTRKSPSKVRQLSGSTIKSRVRVARGASTISLATLKAATSLSEFSEHSYQSGDPELEFDLYDCDLNNVSALPGSMFAHTVYYDVTPTGTEDFELTELFPMLRADSGSNSRKMSSNAKPMIDSLTSDLAASVTSEDLTERKGFNDLEMSDDESADLHETDNLIAKRNRPQALHTLTLIDDISYADD